MPIIHHCQCGHCQKAAPHCGDRLHQQLNLFLSRLNEPQRRWFVGLESNKIGHGGDRIMAEITGMDEKTIRRGRRELGAQLEQHSIDRLRQSGGGRPRALKANPEPSTESDAAPSKPVAL